MEITSNKPLFMLKIITGVLIIIFSLPGIKSLSQQPVLSVQKFDYIWESLTGGEKRVNILSEDSARQSVEKSFTRAMQQRWNISVPEMNLSVKKLGLFSYVPKLNTKVKDKQPGKYYLFLQIFQSNFVNQGNSDSSLSSRLEIKCKVLNGSADSVIFNRDLTINFYYDPAQPNQLVLAKLPAYPAYFIKAMDSVASWLFQIEDVSIKSIYLKPACVFSENERSLLSISRLFFENDGETIHHTTSPSFSLHMSTPTHKKTDTKHNRLGNTLTGALTLFTGVSSSKTKTYEYISDYPIEQGDSIYHCKIGYSATVSTDREREKSRNPDGSKSYSINESSEYLSNRRTDTSFLNFITLGSDTLVTFRFGYLNNEQKIYSKLWDGSDSTTILDLPKEWNNSKEDQNVTLYGEIGSTPFSMKTSNGRSEKDFFINDHLALTIYGKNKPRQALIYQQLSTDQLKLFTIISSLPYSFFNGGY